MRVRALVWLLPVAAAAAVRAAVVLPGVIGIGCGDVPTLPAGARGFAPPAVYATWWQEVERCSGLSGDLSRITWVEVPCAEGEAGFECSAEPDEFCGGEWHPPHTIWLAGPNRILPGGYAADEWTVKHEMLHDLAADPEHAVLFSNCHLLLP